MTEGRGDPHPPCSICASRDHAAIRDDGFLRCPSRPLPAYVTRGLETVAKGICWAAHPDGAFHCTEPPHGAEHPHRNAYVGEPWPDGAIRPS